MDFFLDLCIQLCAPWPGKNLWLIRALCTKASYSLSPTSPSCNSSCSRQKKIMQLCSCHSQSSKGFELFSAQTWLLSTTEQCKKYKKPAKAFLYIGSCDHTPPAIHIHLFSPSSPQLLRHAASWVPLSAVTDHSNFLAPWCQVTFGFTSVTNEFPQGLPMLLSSKDFRVTAETGDRFSPQSV